MEKLAADAALTALMPDGVWWDHAPQGSTRFVIVSLAEEADEAVFGGRAIEDALYIVKAVALSTAGADVKGAAARIDALLDEGSLVLVDYVLMSMHREMRIRNTEVDEADTRLRWQHRGGYYRVQVSLGEVPPSWMETGWTE